MPIIHKCIKCGFEKESDIISVCPECGYKMYPLPYDRKNTLIKEIKDFVVKNEITDIKSSDLVCTDKEKDEHRFPDFEKIQNYVCASKRTEVFFSHYNESINNIKNYIHTPLNKRYKVSISPLIKRIILQEDYLKKALGILSIEIKEEKIKLPKIELDYSEVPDENLLDRADELIELLFELSKKLKKFIEVNNIYGNSFKGKYCNFSNKKECGPLDIIDKEINNIKKILDKKYIVDIFEDGSEEAKEMAKSLWSGIWVLMKLPFLSKKLTYHFNNGVIADEDDYKDKLLEIIAKRYVTVNDILSDELFLVDKHEDELLSLYDLLIGNNNKELLNSDSGEQNELGYSEKRLNELIGLKSVKDSILKIKAYTRQNKNAEDLNLHMCFYGNPGSGKTEVARIIAGILYENKILPTNKVIETDRSGMIGQYVGETPQKVMDKVHAAMGGVLFIDEAYALVSGAGTSNFDYGHEAVATLIKAMEDYRGKFCVILAGYKNEMIQMIQTNPGFQSRIQFTIDFPNYSREELHQIANLMLDKRKYTITDNAINKILDITDVKRKADNFSNAREIRNILDQVIMCQNLRATNGEREIGVIDVNQYIIDSGISVPVNTSGLLRILSADEELNNLIGLESVKKIIKKIKAYAKRNYKNSDFNLHMCFNGNPGTGKTEVARILSRILYEAGVLQEAKVVETDSFGLIGDAIGTTGPKTKAKIQDAMGGVLFIDEAYILGGTGDSHNSSSYGSEAISVLLKEMEDHRGKFCTILAGYKKEMKNMISLNPGFESRIQFTIDFPDYTREELGEIARLMLNKKKYSITDAALSRVLDITDYERARPNFANARNVRNILDQVILNQNLRTEDCPTQDNEIILQDVEDYINEKDILIDNSSFYKKSEINIDTNQLRNDYYDFEEEINASYITQCLITFPNSKMQNTGFIISKEGLCITCAHYIDEDNQEATITLLLSNGKKISILTPFKIVKRDAARDLAILKLEGEIEYAFLPLLSSNYKYTHLKDFVLLSHLSIENQCQSFTIKTGKLVSINNNDGLNLVFIDAFESRCIPGDPVFDSTNMKIIGMFLGEIPLDMGDEKVPCFVPLNEIWDLLN